LIPWLAVVGAAEAAVVLASALGASFFEQEDRR
jgi:hypothetical protein